MTVVMTATTVGILTHNRAGSDLIGALLFALPGYFLLHSGMADDGITTGAGQSHKKSGKTP